MGILASTSRVDSTAADPESLLLFSFEVGRTDPRLFDEVLDWLTVNGDLVSRQRLRNLCVDEEERSLAEACLAWAGARNSALRSSRGSPRNRPARTLAPLFRGFRQPAQLDPTFALFGWARGSAEPTQNSRRPQMAHAVNFSFRLRELFCVGSRAEVVRFLLTSRVSGVQAQAVTAAAGFAERNVLDTLNSLAAAGVVSTYGVGNEYRYLVDLEPWQTLLAHDIPQHRDWPQLLRALRSVARWLQNGDTDGLSGYMRASEARQVMARIQGDLMYAGIAVSDAQLGEAYWDEFVTTVRLALDEGLRP
jgi:hypothetical protein